jgi:bacterioferritin (cytochrome b1)
MAADPQTILLLSYYRDAELRGASLLLRLLSYLHDGDSQTKLALHLAEETRHAWLWTKRIRDLGGAPVQVADGYQSRIGRRTLPRSVLELLALTVVVEERSYDRYREHAARPDVDAETLAILREVSKDEKWHIAWIRGKLEELAAAQGAQAEVEAALEKYRRIDREVYEELLEKERQAFATRALGQAAP